MPAVPSPLPADFFWKRLDSIERDIGRHHINLRDLHRAAEITRQALKRLQEPKP
jgi:hypothetical protein